MQEALGVEGLDGAEEFDGEEHGDGFVEDAGGGGGGAVGFGGVDEVEEGALVAVFFHEVAFVGEEVHFVGFEDGVGGAGEAEPPVRGAHDVEFPGGRRVFAFDC